MSKTPIPIDLPLRFASIVQSMVDPFGINEIPEALNYLALMEREIKRFVLERNLPETSKGMHKERATFIQIFQNYYLKRYGYEYAHSVSSGEAKNIGRLVTLLEKRNFTTEEYLRWVFEVLLERDTNRAVTVSGVTSNHVIEAFFAGNRELADRKVQEGIQRAEKLTFINRLNAVRRKFRGTAKGAEIESFVVEYHKGKTPFDKLRQVVVEWEKI